MIYTYSVALGTVVKTPSQNHIRARFKKMSMTITSIAATAVLAASKSAATISRR